jgi:cytochrome P450 family 12
MRATQMDFVFQGYQIPKDTDIILCAMSLYYDENYFNNSDDFIPERWLKSKNFGEVECPHAKPTHKFAYIPFGFGSR